MNRANPRLLALQRRVHAERQRRNDEGYNDAQVKKVAIYLTMTETDLDDLPPAQSFAIGTHLGLSAEEYLATVEWLNPEHASVLREHMLGSRH
jgi:hypothetical protein